MPALASRIDPSSEAFRSQREELLARVAELRAIEARSRDTEAQAREKFRQRGQLLPRERLALLLDRGSPFLELSTLCGYKHHDDTDGALAGGNTVVGIGFVSGVRCLVFVNNSAVKGGTATPWGVQKSLRAQAIALENKLPVVSLVESGGANLLYQLELFVPGGETFYNQARLSAAGIPQVTVVHGSSTAGGAYIPGLSDHVVMVRGKAKVFLAGPPLLRAATGEVASDEDLGGAEMHATVAGTADHLAEDDADGVRLARELVASLGWDDRDGGLPPREPPAFTPPLYPAEELCGVVPADHRRPYDCREVIARIVDGSDFTPFKDAYDALTVCGWARIEGRQVGLVGNNGPITPRGATKAAQFIQLCCQARTPLVYLQNTTGYMVGTQSEQGGIVKHGAKMLQAVANATVPQLTVLLGGAFGAGNYGMCGRAFHPRFLFAWPNARTAVMGGEQAARVLALLGAEKMRRAGMPVDEAALAEMGKPLVEQFERESDAFLCSARLFDDGVIDPRDTRRVLAFALATCEEAERRTLAPSTFGVARL